MLKIATQVVILRVGSSFAAPIMANTVARLKNVTKTFFNGLVNMNLSGCDNP